MAEEKDRLPYHFKTVHTDAEAQEWLNQERRKAYHLDHMTSVYVPGEGYHIHLVTKQPMYT